MNKIYALAASILVIFCPGCHQTSTSPDTVDELIDDGYVFERWTSSEDLQIAVHSSEGGTRYLTTGFQDFKPSWSTDGSRLTFFRMLAYEQGFGISKTNLAVINEDGTGLRLLTSGDHADFNPTWTRDGTQMVLFTRYLRDPSDIMKIYMISPDGSPGNEVSLSDPSFQYSEWASSGLKDGRIFIDRIGDGFRSYLLTPNPGEKGTYEEVRRNTSYYWHKLSVSPSETRVAYMRYGPGDMAFEDAVICYADFDVGARVISNHVQVTQPDPNSVCEYPRWTADEKYLIYDCNDSGRFQVFAYRLSDGFVRLLSPNPGVNSQYGNFFRTPK
jgi:Tol biopolymer transport system component